MKVEWTGDLELSMERSAFDRIPVVRVSELEQLLRQEIDTTEAPEVVEFCETLLARLLKEETR